MNPNETRLAIPSTEHALLSEADEKRIAARLRESGKDDEVWRYCRKIVAKEILAALTISTHPDLADKPGSLARATGALDALCQLSHRLQKP